MTNCFFFCQIYSYLLVTLNFNIFTFLLTKFFFLASTNSPWHIAVHCHRNRHARKNKLFYPLMTADTGEWSWPSSQSTGVNRTERSGICWSRWCVSNNRAHAEGIADRSIRSRRRVSLSAPVNLSFDLSRVSTLPIARKK